jgi:hypothetical protein
MRFTPPRGSRIPAQEAEGTVKRAGFLRKKSAESSGQATSRRNHGRNCQGRAIPEKETEGIVRRAGCPRKESPDFLGSGILEKEFERIARRGEFFSKQGQEFSGEPPSWPSSVMDSQERTIPGKTWARITRRAGFL